MSRSSAVNSLKVGTMKSLSCAPVLAAHQHLASLSFMCNMLLGRGQRETQALKQTRGAEIVALEHSEEAADFVAPDKLRDHRLDSAAPKATTPVSAAQFVGDSRVSRADCCLNITDEL